ncbi:MAG: tetratricopeptide repeat protein [Candidatus Aquilonibacter sp.]
MLPVFGNPNDLTEIEERLAQAPDDMSLLFSRACTLDMLGRNNEARDAYIEVIIRDGTHSAALGNLGTLLYNAGYRSAARLTYGEAVRHHPRDLRTLINLGNALLENDELPLSRNLYERALEVDPQSAPAHQGLSHVLGRLGQHALAEEHRRAGFEAMPVVLSAFRGEGLPVSLLLLSSAFRGNVPVEVPLDDQTFLTIKLFTDYYESDLPLPPHDVIFNGIGDADLCRASLEAAQALLEANDAHAINDPATVLGTGRVAMVERLAGIEGLIVPHIEELGRDQLDRVQTFPVLLRPPGYHTGEFFEMARDRDELVRVAALLPGERLLAIELLDARGADGLYRKYRFLSIGGTLYPVHLARSSQWKVHYFSADQVRTADAIAEEEAFLANPRAAIGERAMAALETAAQRIGLDYFGIDFALDHNGNALFFEANATMRAVVPVADDPSIARRNAAIAANAALRDLVLRAAREANEPA